MEVTGYFEQCGGGMQLLIIRLKIPMTFAFRLIHRWVVFTFFGKRLPKSVTVGQ